jgi:hypothetical protein
MPKFCVSIFNEEERIIISQDFNHSSIEGMEKEIQSLLYELTYEKPLALNKETGGTLVQELSKGNVKWFYFTFEKRNKKIKYFVILEPCRPK